jgi:hypothetical protein
MKGLYYAFKDAIGDYIFVRRRQDPRWAPSPALRWTYDNLGWVQALLMLGLAAGLVAATGVPR